MAEQITLESFRPLVRETANAFRTDLAYAIAVAKQASSIRARQDAKRTKDSGLTVSDAHTGV